ncbi:MAG: histidine phosphatase family protein [bacterium]|nr:histidine phosphatase family protein [bacterium]
MAVEITFIRHGQTTGNAAGRWQGHTNSSLTAAGQEQAARLGARLAHKKFDLVIASDLDRTVETASALQRPMEKDERWREPFFGDWEDLKSEEIQERYPADLAALFEGEDIAFGGGERLSGVMERTKAALDDVVDRVGDGSVAVVSHGMALLTLVSGLLGTKRPSPLRLLGNTAIATVSVGGSVALLRYNDHTHLDEDGTAHYGHSPEDTEVILARHGQTTSNVERRWQGHQDGMLSELGRSQAALLGESLTNVDALYSSPLSRAVDTAAEIGWQQGLEIQLESGLKERGFGAWEGMTTREIMDAFPDEYQDFRRGVEATPGGNGETLPDVRHRIAESMRTIVSRHPGKNVAVVSHGGATRAWVSEFLGINNGSRNGLGILDNTAHGRVAFTRRGPILVNWNLAPHLT